MRNSTLRAITASVAAVAMIVSVGTSPVLARGGGGGHAGGVRAGSGGFHGGGGFHAGGGFHPGGRTYAHGYHRGYYGGGYYGGGYYGGGYYGGACAANPIPLLNIVSPYWCG
jgi:hypothetical protein